MQYGFYVFIFVILIWFLGIVVAFYHVNKYKMPGDKSLRAFVIFLVFAGAAFLWVINSVTSEIWRS